MKKPDPIRERYQFLAACSRQLRILSKRRAERRERAQYTDWLTIRAPLIVSLEDPIHHAAASEFCARLRKAIYHDRKPTLIDFSQTNRFVSGGTLLVFAELSRLLELTRGIVKVGCLVPKNNKASQVLKQIGLYRLLKKRVQVSVTASDVTKWCAATGVGAEGKKFEPVLGHYDGKISTSLSTSLFNNITEAMTNTGQHAFILPRDDGIPEGHTLVQRWWMFSQEKDGFLSVAFCDLGAGIPETLEIKHPTIVQNLKQALGLKLKDSTYLVEATKLGNSRTGKAFRGKGLYRMKRLVDRMEDGVLLIYSNKGRVRISKNNLAVSDYDSSLFATIIFFKVPLDADPVIYEH